MAKKIVVLGTRGIPEVLGGVETHCQELYPRLVSLGCEVTVLARKPYIDNKKEYKYKNVSVVPLYTPKKKAFEAIIHTFIGLFEAKKIECDILHIHAVGPSLLIPLAKLLGMKVVMTNHGPDYDRQKWGKAAKFMLKLGERWGVKYADSVIVISTVINEIIKRKYGRTDASLIYNGINIPIKSISDDYITTLGLEKDKYIIAVGRFVEEKGLHDLLQAFSMLPNKSIKLVLVGDADHETSYSRNIKKIAAENDVVLTGFIKGEKLNQIFTFAKAFIMPSYHEGLPIALLEALSYNLKVLVSDIPANLEVNLEPSSYFETGNLTELYNGLSVIVDNQRKIESYDLSKYNWELIASQVKEVYNKL